MSGPRLTALGIGSALLLATLAAIALTTPWHPLPGSAPRADWRTDFSLAEHAREQAFHAAVRPPAYLSLAVGLLVVAVLGLSPLGARLASRVAGPVGGGWPWVVVAGVLAVALVRAVASLPFDVRAEQALRRYGLSTQTWSGWSADLAKSTGVSVLIAVLALLPLVALARRMPQWWWAPASVGAAALVLVVSFGYPVLVEPLFNRFTPMAAGELRTSLLELAQEDGVAVDEVLVADASRRTTALNAYVSGFGATKRIVVYDTLLERSTPAEVELIVAHELGHAKRRDVLGGSLLGALGAAALVALLGATLGGRVGDPRRVPLLLALLTLVSFAVGPLTQLVSRRVEARADVHSLELTRDPQTFADSHRRLALTNLSDLDPHPLLYGLFASHPTSPERLALARAWAERAGLQPPPPLAPAPP